VKAIVVELDKREAVVLSDDGLFKRIRNENYEVGQTVSIKAEKRTVSRLAAGAAGVAAAFAVCTIGSFAYFTPVDYVSLDVNPSVEYSANMFDRILDVRAVNDDGVEILSNLRLKNMTIGDAVKTTLDEMIAGGFLTDGPNEKVVIATSNKRPDKAERLAKTLERDIRIYLDSREDIAVKVEAEAVGPDKVKEAKELGVTPGKLNLVEKLQSSTSGAISKEEWLSMPVRDIQKAIKENHKSEKDRKGSHNYRKEKDGRYDREKYNYGEEWSNRDHGQVSGSGLTRDGKWAPDQTDRDDRDGFKTRRNDGGGFETRWNGGDSFKTRWNGGDDDRQTERKTGFWDDDDEGRRTDFRNDGDGDHRDGFHNDDDRDWENGSRDHDDGRSDRDDRKEKANKKRSHN